MEGVEEEKVIGRGVREGGEAGEGGDDGRRGIAYGFLGLLLLLFELLLPLFPVGMGVVWSGWAVSSNKRLELALYIAT